MRPSVAIGIIVVVTAGAGGFLYWQHSRADRAEREAAAARAASDAMKAYNDATPDFEHQLTSAMTDIGGEAMFSPERAGKKLADDVLPLVDGYLAKLDHALAMADAYALFHPDWPPETVAALTKLRGMSKAFHTARDQLGVLAQKAAAGTLSLDDLTHGLAAMATSLMVSR
ncbi:MAG TPA: hypothetical protein VLX92_01465 [Kofleriaceae bacterium]|nr:hypothetical protein [Kofleriaceae bacterium]